MRRRGRVNFEDVVAGRLSRLIEPAGLYLLRLRSSFGTTTRKVILRR